MAEANSVHAHLQLHTPFNPSFYFKPENTRSDLFVPDLYLLRSGVPDRHEVGAIPLAAGGRAYRRPAGRPGCDL
jgi:hypothetical protein